MYFLYTYRDRYLDKIYYYSYMSTASRNCLCEQLKEMMIILTYKELMMQVTHNNICNYGERKELFIDYKIKLYCGATKEETKNSLILNPRL